MTIEEKREKLNSIIEGTKSNPIDVALATLVASSANIRAETLGAILTAEQYAKVIKQMENYRNVYTYLDINDDGNFTLKQQQHMIEEEPIDKGILDPLATCKFAEETIEFDIDFSIRANEYFQTSDDLKRAEREFLKKLAYHITKQIVNKDLDEI